MEIRKEMIKDIDDLFETLAYEMSGSNYCVKFEARKFQYCGNVNFSTYILKKLYGDHIYITESPIAGITNEISYESAKKNIQESICSTYYDDSRGIKKTTGSITIPASMPKNGDFTNINLKTIPIVYWGVYPEIAKQRVDTFWGIINANFTMPPTHCFEHKPEHDSFFGGGVMWEFCYILLNDNTKEGIVIAGQAYD